MKDKLCRKVFKPLIEFKVGVMYIKHEYLKIFTKKGIISSPMIASLIEPHAITTSCPQTCLGGIPMAPQSSWFSDAFRALLISSLLNPSTPY